MMTKSMTKATTRRASTPSNSSGIGDRIVGVRFDVDRHAGRPVDTAAGHVRNARRDARQMGETARLQEVPSRLERRRRQLRHGCATPGDADLTVTLADIEAARRVIAGAGAAHADAAGAAAVGADRRRGLRQIRKSAGHQLVQGARRAQQARLAVGEPSARAASSPCRPATTPRRSPITPRGSAFRRPSSCR